VGKSNSFEGKDIVGDWKGMGMPSSIETFGADVISGFCSRDHSFFCEHELTWKELDVQQHGATSTQVVRYFRQYSIGILQCDEKNIPRRLPVQSPATVDTIIIMYALPLLKPTFQLSFVSGFAAGIGGYVTEELALVLASMGNLEFAVRSIESCGCLKQIKLA